MEKKRKKLGKEFSHIEMFMSTSKRIKQINKRLLSTTAGMLMTLIMSTITIIVFITFFFAKTF